MELNPSCCGESHSSIIHEERSVLLPTLRPMLQIHLQTFVKLHVVYRQRKEQTEVLPTQIFLSLSRKRLIGQLDLSLLSLDVQLNELSVT